MLKTITRAEFQAYFERLLFTDRKRLDMRWNSQNRKEEEEKSEFKLPEGVETFYRTLPALQNAQGLFPDKVMGNFCRQQTKNE